MSSVTISPTATQQLLNDRMFASSQEGSDGKLHLLLYYRRSYTTDGDGAVVEYGDGFSFTLVTNQQLLGTSGIIYEPVEVGPDHRILVGTTLALRASPFIIDWSGYKYTYEPRPVS
jgi:hypothetical protein